MRYVSVKYWEILVSHNTLKYVTKPHTYPPPLKYSPLSNMLICVLIQFMGDIIQIIEIIKNQTALKNDW